MSDTATNPETLEPVEKVSVELSRHDCYAGKERVNVNPFSYDIHDVPGVYLEFQEGCGYDPRELTPDEAIRVGEALIAAGNSIKEVWAIKEAAKVAPKYR